MAAFPKGNCVDMKKLAHIVDSSSASIPAFIQGPIIGSSDNFYHSASLPPSLAHMGKCKMAVIDKTDVDQITTVQLLFYRLDPKPKQGFDETERQGGTLVSYC